MVSGLRKKKKEKNFFKRAVFFLGAGLFLISAGYLIFYSSIFNTIKIQTNNSEIIDKKLLESIVRADFAEESRARRFLGADNILFWFGKKQMADGDLAHPAVKSVSVKINFWKKAVLISAAERKFFALWCKAGKSDCFAIDEFAVPFLRVPETEGHSSLRFVDENPEAIVLGRPVFQFRDAIKNIAAALDGLEISGFHAREVVIKAWILDEWLAKTSEGPEFVFSFQNPVQNLKEILEEMKKKAIADFKVADFTVPEKIYIK